VALHSVRAWDVAKLRWRANLLTLALSSQWSCPPRFARPWGTNPQWWYRVPRVLAQAVLTP
jgi:hypothetical protein